MDIVFLKILLNLLTELNLLFSIHKLQLSFNFKCVKNLTVISFLQKRIKDFKQPVVSSSGIEVVW